MEVLIQMPRGTAAIWHADRMSIFNLSFYLLSLHSETKYYLCSVENIGKDIELAAQYLKDGLCVGIPTETVYGLAANAFNSSAVASVFKIKNRPSFDPLILHVDTLAKVESLISHFPPKAKRLAQAFWPGPLTMVLPKASHVPYDVTSGLETVGVRIPNHSLTLELLSKLDFPLAAPSANPFGYVSPTSAQHVADSLGNKPAYILDGGSCERGIESTIIGFEGDEPVLYRLGSLAVADIENEIGPVKRKLNTSSNPQAPGQLKMHYAPKVRLLNISVEEALENYPQERIGQISLQENSKKLLAKNCLVLSEKGDLYEAAHNLFASLRKLDGLDVDVAVFEYLDDEGVGAAINDRLRRASAKSH